MGRRFLCWQEIKLKVETQELQRQRNCDGKPESATLLGYP